MMAQADPQNSTGWISPWRWLQGPTLECLTQRPVESATQQHLGMVQVWNSGVSSVQGWGLMAGVG